MLDTQQGRLATVMIAAMLIAALLTIAFGITGMVIGLVVSLIGGYILLDWIDTGKFFPYE